MSTSERLDMATFEQLLEIHGSRLERWPEATREPVKRLLEASELARTRLSDAERLDALLDAVPMVEPTAELMARITSLPARHPRAERAVWWPLRGSLAPLFAWGAAAALGVMLGVFSPDFADDLSTGDLGTSDAVSVEQVDAPDQATLDDSAADGDDGSDDWSDMSGLALGGDWAAEDD